MGIISVKRHFLPVPKLHQVRGERLVDSESSRFSRTQPWRSMGPLRRSVVRGLPGRVRPSRLSGGHERGRFEDRSPQHPRELRGDN